MNFIFLLQGEKWNIRLVLIINLVFPVSSLDYFPPNPELESCLYWDFKQLNNDDNNNNNNNNRQQWRPKRRWHVCRRQLWNRNNVVVVVVFSLKLVLLFDRLMRYLIAGHREFYMEYCRVLLDLNRVAEKKNSFLRRSARPRICIEWDHLKFSTFRIQQRIYSTTFNVNT